MKRSNPTRNVPHGNVFTSGVGVDGKRSRTDFAGASSRAAKRLERAALTVAPKPPQAFALVEDLAEDLPVPVYGQYPKGLIEKLLPWLRCERREILHICSGALPPGEGIRVDIRPEAKPDILADGRKLPLADGTIAAVMCDPPYTPDYARSLYGVDYPRPAHLLAEAARVVRPGGRIVFVHYISPSPVRGIFGVKRFGLDTGSNMPMRAVSIYEREQARLL